MSDEVARSGRHAAGQHGAEPMDVRYCLDPDAGLPHIFGHGITEAEAEYILKHPGQERPRRDQSRHAMGQTAAGRYLRVIFVRDVAGDGVFVVTAWEMRGNELRSYRRRRRR